ncbi:phosphotransferase [Amycolatopsis sp. NPDC059090]|uniref:phosphotransferase n=1 Tax=unclassified Amycolatopsis TaxID=2618356 RepID=UPI0036730070
MRRIAGPFVIRTCLHDEAGHHWVERLRQSPEGYLDADGVRTVAAALGETHGCLMPIVVSPDLALWPGVANAELLSDRLLSGGLARDNGYWRESLYHLGALAGRIHSAPISEDARRTLPARGTGPAWLTAPVAAAGVREARARLPQQLAPSLASAAAQTDEPASTTLVHGRFSAGACTADRPPCLLGWREAGLGDPLHDLAFLIADLIETGSATGCPPTVLREHVATFVSAYPLDFDENGLWSAVARRILDHYALGIWATRDSAGVDDLLPAVEASWLAVQERVR